MKPDAAASRAVHKTRSSRRRPRRLARDCAGSLDRATTRWTWRTTCSRTAMPWMSYISQPSAASSIRIIHRRPAASGWQHGMAKQPDRLRPGRRWESADHARLNQRLQHRI